MITILLRLKVVVKKEVVKTQENFLQILRPQGNQELTNSHTGCLILHSETGQSFLISLQLI